MNELVPILVDEEEVERFRVLIDAKTRHADLWPLVRQFGSGSALAKDLKIDNTTMSKWINLHAVPSRVITTHIAAADRLHTHTGKSYDELWPPALCAAVRKGVAAQRTAVAIETSYQALAQHATERLTLPPADVEAEAADETEREAELVRRLLDGLENRYQECIRLRFFDAKTLAETAKEMGITRERVRQIELRALLKMREKVEQLEVEMPRILLKPSAPVVLKKRIL